MEADGTCSAKISPTSGSLCLSSETKSSGELPGAFPDGLCPRCQRLKFDDRYLGNESQRKWKEMFPVPYSLMDMLPELPLLSRSARYGCKFCTLLKPIISELVSNHHHHECLENLIVSIRNPDYRWSLSGGLSYLELVARFEKLSHLEYKAEYKIHFEVESLEGDSGKRLNITRRPLESHPLSANNVAKFKSWLHQCHSDHEECQYDRNTKRLPTRLLAVGGEPPNESPRVIVCSEHPTLVDCEKTPYTALSHCWGKGITPMKTERHSISDRMKCIPLDTMPRTYHDAVLLTRSLGISYLWIDSLCIVQDDKDDWKRESSSMAEVYQNAYLTLCALVTSCNDGLFRGSREPGVSMPFNSQIKEDVHGEYFLRPAAVTSSGGENIGPFRRIYKAIRNCDDVRGSSWYSRGWTFQEELFSTRRLLCSERMIYLDCNMVSFTENSMLDAAVFKSFPSLLRRDYSDLFSAWYHLISLYSERSLTYEEDRLPAVSSLAAAFADRTKDQYIAGLWMNDLPHGLLWHRVDDVRERPSLSDLVKRLTCSSKSISPSWSWACEGRISKWPERIEPHFVQCKVLEALSETDNLNPFGSITGSHLLMEGNLFQVSHFSLLGKHGDSFSIESSGAALGEWYLDFDPAKGDLLGLTREWDSDGVSMFILTKKVYSSPCFGILSGLLLYPTASPNEYLRVGTFSKQYMPRLDHHIGEDQGCGPMLGQGREFIPSLLYDFLESAPCRTIRLV